MGGVAGEEDAADAEALGDLGGHPPGARRGDGEGELGIADGLADPGAEGGFVEVLAALVGGGDEGVVDPAALDVVGDEDAGGARAAALTAAHCR
jgi:hypothetical protein